MAEEYIVRCQGGSQWSSGKVNHRDLQGGGQGSDPSNHPQGITPIKSLPSNHSQGITPRESLPENHSTELFARLPHGIALENHPRESPQRITPQNYSQNSSRESPHRIIHRIPLENHSQKTTPEHPAPHGGAMTCHETGLY